MPDTLLFNFYFLQDPVIYYHILDTHLKKRFMKNPNHNHVLRGNY